MKNKRNKKERREIGKGKGKENRTKMRAQRNEKMDGWIKRGGTWDVAPSCIWHFLFLLLFVAELLLLVLLNTFAVFLQ